ncbi:translation initiation factor 2 [Streptomyces sp. NPDC058067]|uniref:translation initiation factor 2 n=1 Tax=Streptomyces sp. NPDC058067 TaxID=3346324 RepID=UPI0036EC18F5
MGTLGATGDRRPATGDRRPATRDPRPATRDTGGPRKTVLLAARSAVALYRLLDVLPVFAGDERVTRLFTLVPGSAFGVDALAAIHDVGGRTVPWSEACASSYDLILTASPKGDVRLLRGKHVLLPHGAGFNKAIPGEGSPDAASGLDPAYLLPSAAEPLALHALAHSDQVARLAAVSPQSARHAKVVGDPTLERILASSSLRERYRAALGTGPRKLLALVSTWGPDCLIRQRPGLPAELAGQLPYDEYQLALIVHPNERVRLGSHELAERLAPALDAGLVLAGPHEEWASVLVAADALITDHGSAALYFAAERDRPIVSVHRGGTELISGSPMDVLLGQIPELGRAETVVEALSKYRPGIGESAAQAAFTGRGAALRRLRAAVYDLLGLAPPAFDVSPRLLPPPPAPSRTPAAFDVHAEITRDGIRVRRHPAGLGSPGRHLAVEFGAAGEHLVRSAGLLYRRPLPSPPDSGGVNWTAGGWTRHALSQYPGCRSAAALTASGRWLLRTRGHTSLYLVKAEPSQGEGQIVRVDPAAALSAVHTWLAAVRGIDRDETWLTCLVGERAFCVLVRPATDDEAGQTV